MTCGSLLGARLVKLSVASTTNALASSTEESLHTVQVSNVLGSLMLSFALAVVDFLLVTLMLKVATVIAKSVIRTTCAV